MPGQTTKLLPACYFLLDVAQSTIGVFISCSGLEFEYEVMEYAEGGNNDFIRHLPGRVRYPHLTLTRGLTHQKDLLEWLEQTRTEPRLQQIRLQCMNNSGEAVRTWTFAEAFPVRWSGPTFDANSHAIAVETLTIAHSGMKEG